MFGVYNVSPGLANRGEQVIMELFIDDGVVGRGHRSNIWDSTYRKTGIAHCETANRETLVVITYAGNFVIAPARQRAVEQARDDQARAGVSFRYLSEVTVEESLEEGDDLLIKWLDEASAQSLY